MADTRPNIVFVMADNVGWGDWSCYGGSTPTPRIDQLAAEGIRFTNHCVENECTPTRTAIMTGRQSVRCGTYTAIPMHGGPTGLSPWEYTIANLLSDAGYATSHFGKWHLGEIEGRLPTDQGFDEWWGYRNSANECGWTSYAAFAPLAKEYGIYTPMIWEGTKGGKQTAVRRAVAAAVEPLPGQRPQIHPLLVDVRACCGRDGDGDRSGVRRTVMSGTGELAARLDGVYRDLHGLRWAAVTWKPGRQAPGRWTAAVTVHAISAGWHSAHRRARDGTVAAGGSGQPRTVGLSAARPQ